MKKKDQNQEDLRQEQPPTEEAKAQSPQAAQEPAGAAAEGGLSDPMAALQAERDELYSRLQRLSADFANYQRRTRREVEESRDLAVADVIRAFVAVLDDLERAIEHAKANHPPDDPLLVGTQLVYDKARAVLTQLGVQSVEASGEFDPTVHEALMQQPTAEAPPMTVLSEVQKGYVYKGRTIRPAKVIVASPPAPEGDEDDESGASQE